MEFSFNELLWNEIIQVFLQILILNIHIIVSNRSGIGKIKSGASNRG